MDRNTILAVILCVLVITIGMSFQQSLAVSAEEAAMAQAMETQEDVVALNAASNISALGSAKSSSPFNVATDALDITFDPQGASVVAVKDVKNNVNLLLKEESDPNAFMLYWGNDKTSPVQDTFSYVVEEKAVAGKSDSITQVTFTRDYQDKVTGRKFTLEKRYAIPNNSEYMIQLAVTVYTEDGNPIPVNVDGSLYSISVGPQVGPEFESLNRNYDYRRIYYKLENKNSRKTVGNGNFNSSAEMDWVGIVGKYFAFLLIPETNGIVSYTETIQDTSSEILAQKNTVYMTRKATGNARVTDVYSLYMGPQLASTLGVYDNAKDNVFGLSDHNLKKALDVSWLSWLENILKFVLQLFYRIIPNYGVAIILVTILIKIILIPLSKKGTESTAKMSALQPKLQEIQEKYKDDPQAQNEAIGKLYREEGINPMGSCWPMLIQFPVFIALYGLLNKNFDLRGAMFIAGWINDLSIPETIFTLPFNFPLIGADIHLLPILYTASMIFTMKITQSTSAGQAGSKGMMWFMTYGMSIMFFFILYNAPSGLLLYWSVSNILSIGQQMWTNKKKVSGFKEEIAAKDAAVAAKKAAKKKGRR